MQLLPAHRSLSLAEAAAEFPLETLWNEWQGPRYDDLASHFNSDDRVLVFDGDTRFDSPLDRNGYEWQKMGGKLPDPFNALCRAHNLMVVNGSLNAAYLRTWGLHGIFVFGDLDCDKIDFYGACHSWIQGHLRARTAVLATGQQDNAYNAEDDGRRAVCVRGTASAPQVRSWWVRLSHLDWTAGSGQEFCEDDKLEFEEQLKDAIWNAPALPTAPAFDFAALKDAIVAACEAAFAEVSARQQHDPVRAFALYTDSGAMAVCPAMATASYLEKIRHDEPDDLAYYRFTPAEWPLESVGAEQAFNALSATLRTYLAQLPGVFDAFKPQLVETLVQSAETLRQGCFAKLGDDFIVVVDISDEEEPAQTLTRRMSRLNPPAIAKEFWAWTKTW